eukprot:3714545-Prymnesium_polylepis.1
MATTEDGQLQAFQVTARDVGPLDGAKSGGSVESDSAEFSAFNLSNSASIPSSPDEVPLECTELMEWLVQLLEN